MINYYQYFDIMGNELEDPIPLTKEDHEELIMNYVRDIINASPRPDKDEVAEDLYDACKDCKTFKELQEELKTQLAVAYYLGAVS